MVFSEDYRLLKIAEARMQKAKEYDFVSAAEAMRILGITETDLKKANADSGQYGFKDYCRR